MSRVQSIERAFAVLGALADGPVGVTEVADRVDLPKSTVARLLASLGREGAVEQIPGERRYRLGPRVSSLAASIRPTRSLIDVARPPLAELSRAVGEAAGLSVPDGRAVHYVDQVDSPHPVAIRDWTGTRVPMHVVSSGQVFLAALAPAALDRYLERPLERFTDRTIVDPDRLRTRLREVQVDGWAWVRDEYSDGITSVAAPVPDGSGELVAAVHVHGPSYRFPAAGADRAIAERVVGAAAVVSARLRDGG
ncbi:MAG: IclR family transcriptional regulator [Chloroflexota bacterium]